MLKNNDNLLAALRSLEGLSVGDAFGECFFSISLNPLSLEMHLATHTLPNWRWYWTDDTAMAVSIFETLKSFGAVNQDHLAGAFARRYADDDRRGYGGTAHGILRAIGDGRHWSSVSPTVLSGMGSMGNGGAMRVAPLGAYFAGDTATVVEQAKLSAEVTHAHADGQAGAVAVALAAAFVRTNSDRFSPAEFFDYITAHTPDSRTRALIQQASELPTTYSVETVVSVVGNGSQITAPDTVPFCLWCVAKSGINFEDAMWLTVEGSGDIDTNCAIVGGILSAAPRGAPPAQWIAHREPLPETCST